MPSITRLLRRRSPQERAGTMTVIEHLEELRHRMVICLIALALASVVGWLLYPAFLDLVRKPFCAYVAGLPVSDKPVAGCRLLGNTLLDPLLVKLKIVVFLGLFVCLPVLLYQLWAFIVPGLTAKERKMAVPFIVSSTLLFILGATVAYVTLPKALQFLLGFAGPDVTPLITFSSYVMFVLLVALAFGLSFEFPILLIFLTIVGVLSSARLRAARRWAILGIAFFAAFITPSSDPYTMLAMMIPMVLFYEASIIVARMMKK